MSMKNLHAALIAAGLSPAVADAAYGLSGRLIGANDPAKPGDKVRCISSNQNGQPVQGQVYTVRCAIPAGAVDHKGRTTTEVTYVLKESVGCGKVYLWNASRFERA